MVTNSGSTILRVIALASRQRPPKESATAGSREFRFYVSKAPEINRRFAGKHVAIIGDRIVASGKSPLKVYKRAKKSHPQSRPFLAYVPKGEILFSVRRQTSSSAL